MNKLPGNNPGSNIEGIKKAVGEGFRKHMEDYDTEIIPIPIAYDDFDDVFKYETDELTSVCPVTGLPDFYDLSIEMVATHTVPELKTLKFYLLAYRNVGILHEDLAPKILSDIKDACEPHWIRVTLVTKARGGIRTTVVSEKGERPLSVECR